MRLIVPVLLSLMSAGCQQYVATAQANNAPVQVRPRELTTLLATMQAADENPDAVRRCMDYPSPPGVKWSKASIAARCALLEPLPEFLAQGFALVSKPEGAVIWDAGFKALMDDTQVSPAIKDGRIYGALNSFSSAASLPNAEAWLARNPQSPFAHAAKGASLLAMAQRARGERSAAATDLGDLDSAARVASAAANELQQAYSLEPRLSAACALRADALRLSAGSDAALDQGRACSHAHPQSYFAASSWAFAAEPRWGGGGVEQAEVMAFLEKNAARNPLLASIVGKIKAYDLMAAGLTTNREDLEQLQAYAASGPNAGMLNFIASSWQELGEADLSMAYLSSAVRFDFDPGDRHRFMRASLNSVRRPEWAALDYRILKERYRGDPSLALYLAQAEENARNETGLTYSREGSVTYGGDLERKATLLSECLKMGTSDRAAYRDMRDCSDSLVSQWPDDPVAWYVRALVLRHQGRPEWKDAARRYLAMADTNASEERQRIESIREQLDASNAPDSAIGEPQGPPSRDALDPTQVRPADRKVAAVLSRMLAAEAITDTVQRCTDYPNPAGAKWDPRMIEALCAQFAPPPAFVRETLASLPSPHAIDRLESGFAALVDDKTGSSTQREARMQSAFRAFDDPAMINEMQEWQAHAWSDRKWSSPFARTARGISLLAKEQSLDRPRTASDAPGAMPSRDARFAKQAVWSLQSAYKTQPLLSAACAWGTMALRRSAGGEAAIASGRKCAHDHPESHAAIAAWKTASEPRWGGSRKAMAEVAAFAREHLKANPLQPAIIDAIEATAMAPAGAALAKAELEQLQSIALRSPNPELLAQIAEGWRSHGRHDLWLMYLSSAIRFDPQDREQLRALRAEGTLAYEPEWAVVDFRYLKDKHWQIPSPSAFLDSAEYAVSRPVEAAKRGQVAADTDTLLDSKARVMQECEQLLNRGVMSRKAGALRPCADRLVTRWPDDPDCWYLRARLLNMVRDPNWRPSAERYLKILVHKDDVDARRVSLIEQLLEHDRT